MTAFYILFLFSGCSSMFFFVPSSTFVECHQSSNLSKFIHRMSKYRNVEKWLLCILIADDFKVLKYTCIYQFRGFSNITTHQLYQFANFTMYIFSIRDFMRAMNLNRYLSWCSFVVCARTNQFIRHKLCHEADTTFAHILYYISPTNCGNIEMLVIQ